MKHRGLTLVELLLALALASSLCLGAAQWIQITSRCYVEQSARSRWIAAADAVAALIQHDALVGDFASSGDPTRLIPRVEFQDSNLRIRTRINGVEAIRSYGLDSGTKTMFSLGHGRNPAGRRVLLELVESWTCAYHDQTRTLRIELFGPNGMIAHHEIRAA